MRLGLGTAQFGLSYGISNLYGQTPIDEVKKILEFAVTTELKVLDTATAYGDSEAVLGSVLSQITHDFQIVTKIPGCESGLSAGSWTEDCLSESLRSLKQESLYAVMCHSADDLLGLNGNAIFTSLEKLRSKGKIEKIGVSVYHPEQLERLTAHFKLDLVQLPLSIFDQRFLQSGWLDRLSRDGIEVHTRSAFLQGLLLMDPSTIPAYFEPHRSRITAYQNAILARQLSPLDAALAFVFNSCTSIESVICGVNNCGQLEKICEAVDRVRGHTNMRFLTKFASDDLTLIDPSRWRI